VNATASKALFDAEVAKLTQRVLDARGWVIHARDFPTLDLSFTATGKQTLRLGLGCDNWNELPPSVTLCGADGAPLAALPAQQSLPGVSTIFNSSLHHLTGKPFVCMIGLREYHTHPSHVRDLWSNYKAQERYALGGVLTQLWRGWERFWP
jgi:hypothetical protein